VNECKPLVVGALRCLGMIIGDMEESQVGPDCLLVVYRCTRAAAQGLTVCS
jgi:hypothetical protein